MGYAIMRFSKIKNVNTGNGILRHIRREITIPTLTHPENKNVKITMSNSGVDYSNCTFKQILDRKLNGKKPRANSVLGLEFIFAFTPGCVEAENIRGWATASLQWLSEKFGSDNIICSVLHNDEKSPHIHAVVIPMFDGKLNCKHYINGPASCREMQDTYYQAVKDFGDLERGINSKITKRIHESNKRWMARNAENEQTLTAYQKTFGKEDEWDFDTLIQFNRNKTEEMTAVKFRLSDRAI